ncbi:Uncharacterized protein dnl_34050 [Desulfonema limicola]|uniref:Uncharacterized protein n=1 Tax=Desulfonema limicola TaxID=45656 RepID=A0A975B9K4_9BACT|nr:Uncharacterized protein dnl_34050 [Desulfonema limicola]
MTALRAGNRKLSNNPYRKGSKAECEDKQDVILPNLDKGKGGHTK